MKKSIIISSILLFLSCNIWSQTIPNVKNHSIETSVEGDLDKDGINEIAVIYLNDIKEEDYDNQTRQLIIYKLKNNQWQKWQESNEIILGNKDGGMMGDPFEGIEIKNGIFITHHYGGSAWRWAYTEKYRFQNGDFYLIGYTENYGRYGLQWKSFDFNLSTGRIDYTCEFNKEEELANDPNLEDYKYSQSETFYKKGLKIKMNNRKHYNVNIESPKYKETLSL